MEDKDIFGITEISVDLVRSDQVCHADCQGFSVGKECFFYFNGTLSFTWDLPCFFNGDIHYYISRGVPLNSTDMVVTRDYEA